MLTLNKSINTADVFSVDLEFVKLPGSHNKTMKQQTTQPTSVVKTKKEYEVGTTTEVGTTIAVGTTIEVGTIVEGGTTTEVGTTIKVDITIEVGITIGFKGACRNLSSVYNGAFCKNSKSEIFSQKPPS